MLECRMPCLRFKKVMEAMKELVSEANFDFSEAGMHVQAMDSSHVSLVSLQWDTSYFDHFRCDRPCTVGIHLSNLCKVLKCCDGEDVLTLSHREGEDVLSLLFESPHGDRVSDFELKLLQLHSDQLGVPDVEWKCEATLPSSELQRICKDFAALGDTLSLSMGKEGVAFSLSGQTGKANVCFRHSDSVRVQHGDEEVIHQFSLKYLSSFTKTTLLSPSVRLSFSSDTPLRVTYPEEGLTFFLAPKIES